MLLPADMPITGLFLKSCLTIKAPQNRSKITGCRISATQWHCTDAAGVYLCHQFALAHAENYIPHNALADVAFVGFYFHSLDTLKREVSMHNH